ncbi:MAG TPA: hypothetical protein PKV16_04850 [Caldisericia bacterium]|nr:hypothetical protein [Caldisericia bacterium]HPF48640.1 hypothetical protein [Caldisericia bacterium]HPI83700.1 hypothetical protein [Caldisericia bacterium]HPQ93095.1 hypothetical protein [Caldisericia bacterium]HRV75072.1 hypothetical protein [Caldisericia bacterium]
MPVEYELVNLHKSDERVELVRILSPSDKDAVFSLESRTLLAVNFANVDKYVDYPRTIPLAYRVGRKIEGIIIGVPIERHIDDETFPDPDMGRRNTVYTPIFQVNDGQIGKKLEADYLAYLKHHSIKFESRHMPYSWFKNSGFDLVAIFDQWRVDGSPVAYCKRTTGK